MSSRKRNHGYLVLCGTYLCFQDMLTRQNLHQQCALCCFPFSFWLQEIPVVAAHCLSQKGNMPPTLRTLEISLRQKALNFTFYPLIIISQHAHSIWYFIFGRSKQYNTISVKQQCCSVERNCDQEPWKLNSDVVLGSKHTPDVGTVVQTHCWPFQYKAICFWWLLWTRMEKRSLAR